MIKSTAFETDQQKIEASAKAASSLPDGYRIAPARGYFYPQKQIQETWLYFPVHGLLLIEKIDGAKRCLTYENAAAFVKRHARSEQKAWESGMFDGIPTSREYDYSGSEALR